MRVSALRITRPQAPPPPFLWDGFEDVLADTLRHGRLYTETEVSEARNGHNAEYQLLLEKHQKQWVAEQKAKNKALALAEYEWRKPENVAARLIKAKAAYAAQQAQEAARANALREQLVASEAARILREDEEAEAERAWFAAQRATKAERLEAESAAAVAWWASINPHYRYEVFRPCRFDRPMRFGRVSLEANKGYLLPQSVRAALLEQLGY